MASRRVGDIFQIKVTLLETDPVVWRRLLVPASMTLAKFHGVLQTAMGWTNSHLHCFEIGDRRIGMINLEEDADDLEDERRVRLLSLIRRKEDSLIYQYDYGDSWKHLVDVEAVMHPDERCAYPLCIGGERACPPEDCGGTYGYENLLRVLKSPKDEEYDSMLMWLGGYFDPAGFDANAVNMAFRSHRR
jgi:hypothetical protein